MLFLVTFLPEKQMLKRTSTLVFSVLLLCSISVWAQGPAAPDMSRPATDRQRLYSPAVSKLFYELAYDLAGVKEVTGPEVEQAMAFLTAALSLDSDARGAREL